MNKKLIFTFIIGDYDNLKTPNVISDGWDYICYTDNKSLTSDIWEIRDIHTIEKQISCNKRKTSMIKLNSSRYVDDVYDLSISIDASMVINTNLDVFLSENGWNETCDVMLNKHPLRNCIYVEANAINASKKDYIDNTKNHVDILKQNNYPTNNGLYSGGYIVRRNTKKVNNFFSWLTNLYCVLPSKREQMVINYGLWLYNMEHQSVTIKTTNWVNVYKTKKYFIIHPHKIIQTF